MNEQQKPQPITYPCSAGETFDIVALHLYGDVRYAAELLTANPSLCHLLRFSGGEVLEAPQIEVMDVVDETGASVTTPPWKE